MAAIFGQGMSACLAFNWSGSGRLASETISISR